MDTHCVIDPRRLLRQLHQVRLQHARTPPKTSFYDLPIELRLAIYALAYRGIPIEVSWNGWSCNCSSPYRPSSSRHVCPQNHNYKDLMVDKQYHSEAITPFYREAVWHFLNLDYLERFVLLAPKACRENIRSIVVLRDHPEKSSILRLQIWTTRINNDTFPRLEHLTLHPVTPSWVYWTQWDNIQVVYRALEEDESGAKLLALRGLKSFTLIQVPFNEWWNYLWFGRHLYVTDLSERMWQDVLCQIEARIASVVCQPIASAMH